MLGLACLDVDKPEPPLRYVQWTTDRERRRASSSSAGGANYSSHALLVPTFAKHGRHFCVLLDSVLRNVRSRDGPLLLFGVFSSHDDRTSILGTCRVCGDWPSSSLDLRSFIFRPPRAYLNREREEFVTKTKFNFQAAKKLWSLAQLRAERVLVLDSDFVVTRPIELEAMLQRYGSVLYETSTSLQGFDERVVAATNELLGISSDRFLMEPPWIFEPRRVRQLSSPRPSVTFHDFS